jgi:pyridoxal phosphate enzyme (YggS family)
MSIGQQYARVFAEVGEACRACGRDIGDVALVAVSKTVDAVRVQEAVDAGAVDFGENRPEQIVQKSQMYPQSRWHYIGNLQSRRIADVVPCAHLIHSVYQEHHLPKIDAAAADCGKLQDILLEVNVSNEQSKGGVAPEDASELLRAACAFPYIRVRGLMTMAPQGDLHIARECFADLRGIRDQLNRTASFEGFEPLSELSMGMSEDWQCAIAEGATIVRIGRAIFSEDFA